MSKLTYVRRKRTVQKHSENTYKHADFHVSYVSSCKQLLVKILQNLYMKMSSAAEADFKWFWKSKIDEKLSKID